MTQPANMRMRTLRDKGERRMNGHNVASARLVHSAHRLRLSDDVVELHSGAMYVSALSQQLRRAPPRYLHAAASRPSCHMACAQHVSALRQGLQGRQGQRTSRAPRCLRFDHQLHKAPRELAVSRTAKLPMCPPVTATDAPSSAACSRLATKLLRTRRNSCHATRQ